MWAEAPTALDDRGNSGRRLGCARRWRSAAVRGGGCERRVRCTIRSMTTPDASTATQPAQPQTCDGRGFLGGEPCPWEQVDLWRDGAGRCVFHSEDDFKDHDVIRTEWERMRGQGVINCRGWVIPFSINLIGALRIQYLNLAWADLRAEVALEGITLGHVDLEGASFLQRASFEGTTFKYLASFNSCVFEAVSFSGAVFESRADFTDAKLGVPAWFSRTTFIVAPRFKSTTLRSTMFMMTDFRVPVSLSMAMWKSPFLAK